MLYVEAIPTDYQEAPLFMKDLLQVQFCRDKNASFSYSTSSVVIALQSKCFKDKVTRF